MDDSIELIPGRDDSLGRVLGLYDTPAYVRRGLQLAESRDRVFRHCAATRTDWLRWVRIHLRLLRQQVGDWSELRDLLESDRDCALLGDLAATLLPGWNGSPHRRQSSWGLRRQLRSLIESIERFNDRWIRFLAGLDLSQVNARVLAYNRYYLLEKECAMRSPRLAAKGFEPARELSRDELASQFPVLPVPRIR